MTTLDDQDEKLIAALRRDGRASLSELAGVLGLSRATVRARMDRLAARGEIAGFTVLTRGDVTAGHLSEGHAVKRLPRDQEMALRFEE